MQLSCVNCSQQQLWNPQMMEPQWHPKNLNGSNMSLNLPQGGFYPQSFGTTWMNNGSYQKPDPYSYPFGMMPYNNGKILNSLIYFGSYNVASYYF